MKMNIQYFAESGADSNSEGSSSEVDVASLQATVATLTKELNNAKAQNANLLSKQSNSSNTSSAASVTNSSAAPAPSSANDNYSSLQAENKSLADAISSLNAIQEASKQRASFTSKAAKDDITLSNDDFEMILGSSDPDKAYKYVKTLKANEPKHPNKNFPDDTNVNKPKENQRRNVGKELFEEMNNDKSKDLSRFMPGHF